MKTIQQTLLMIAVFNLILLSTYAQNAGIADDGNSFTPNSSSILELKSTSKGMLIPRMTSAQRTAISSPATSLLVYQTDATAGFYYYSGTAWVQVATGAWTLNPVTKTANATLAKTETFVLASNDITITLPVVTSTDNGLAITVKNVGGATDLVIVQGSSSATIDNLSNSKLTRWRSKTYIANNGNWMLKERENLPENIFDVSSTGSWTTLSEVISFLNVHMDEASVVRLNTGSYPISSTININLPYPLTIEAISYGNATITADSGLLNKPMFRCQSECYFKMLTFDGSTLSTYGTHSGEDAIRFIGADTYNEVKDNIFTNFYRGVVDSTNAELWVFETDFENMGYSGIQITGSASGLSFKIAESDFINCRRGLELKKGTNVITSIMSCGFYNENSTDSAVTYNAGNITFEDMFFTNNTWNNVGKFFTGYDFTRSDGRDANIKIMNNSGIEDQNPKCKINVRNNTTATTISSGNTWYKVGWNSATCTNITCKFVVDNNKITYKPANKMYGLFIITGNIAVSSASRIVSIGIVKNGVSGTRYGECDLRPSSANVPMQFSTVVYIGNVSATDYFELYVTADAACSVTFQDVQWFTTTY